VLSFYTCGSRARNKYLYGDKIMASRISSLFFLVVSVLFIASCRLSPQQARTLKSAQGDLSVEYSRNTGAIAKYDVFEITFQHDVNYAEPFFDVTIDVVFTSPSKERIRVGGFHYGSSSGPTIRQDEIQTQRGPRQQVSYHFDTQDLWKARFAPSELGRWKYDFVFRDVEGREARGRGTFDCVKGHKPAPGSITGVPIFRSACRIAGAIIRAPDRCWINALWKARSV